MSPLSLPIRLTTFVSIISFSKGFCLVFHWGDNGALSNIINTNKDPQMPSDGPKMPPGATVSSTGATLSSTGATFSSTGITLACTRAIHSSTGATLSSTCAGANKGSLRLSPALSPALSGSLHLDQVSQKCVSRLGETTLACKSGRLVETKRHTKKQTLGRDPAEVCMRG